MYWYWLVRQYTHRRRRDYLHAMTMRDAFQMRTQTKTDARLVRKAENKKMATSRPCHVWRNLTSTFVVAGGVLGAAKRIAKSLKLGCC